MYEFRNCGEQAALVNGTEVFGALALSLTHSFSHTYAAFPFDTSKIEKTKNHSNYPSKKIIHNIQKCVI